VVVWRACRRAVAVIRHVRIGRYEFAKSARPLQNGLGGGRASDYGGDKHS